MDELHLIRQFRGELAAAAPDARAAARAKLVTRIEGHGRPRLVRPQRRVVLAFAVLVAVLAAGAALGLADPIVDLIRGKSPPAPVTMFFERWNDPPPPNVRWNPAVRVDEARGVLGARTSVGLVGVWAAATVDGGYCMNSGIVDISGGRLLQPLGGACNDTPPPRGVIHTFLDAVERWNTRRVFAYALGITRRDVAFVEIRLHNGRRLRARAFDGYFGRVNYFAAELPCGARVAAIVGFDTQGKRIARDPHAATQSAGGFFGQGRRCAINY